MVILDSMFHPHLQLHVTFEEENSFQMYFATFFTQNSL